MKFFLLKVQGSWLNTPAPGRTAVRHVQATRRPHSSAHPSADHSPVQATAPRGGTKRARSPEYVPGESARQPGQPGPVRPPGEGRSRTAQRRREIRAKQAKAAAAQAAADRPSPNVSFRQRERTGPSPKAVRPLHVSSSRKAVAARPRTRHAAAPDPLDSFDQAPSPQQYGAKAHGSWAQRTAAIQNLPPVYGHMAELTGIDPLLYHPQCLISVPGQAPRPLIVPPTHPLPGARYATVPYPRDPRLDGFN